MQALKQDGLKVNIKSLYTGGVGFIIDETIKLHKDQVYVYGIPYVLKEDLLLHQQEFHILYLFLPNQIDECVSMAVLEIHLDKTLLELFPHLYGHHHHSRHFLLVPDKPAQRFLQSLPVHGNYHGTRIGLDQEFFASYFPGLTIRFFTHHRHCAFEYFA